MPLGSASSKVLTRPSAPQTIFIWLPLKLSPLVYSLRFSSYFYHWYDGMHMQHTCQHTFWHNHDACWHMHDACWYTVYIHDVYWYSHNLIVILTQSTPHTSQAAT